MARSPVEPITVLPPSRLHRVGRVTNPLNFSVISAGDAALPTAGNRFDVPGEGVCYLSSSAVGCYAETLARYRPSPGVIKALHDEDPHFMVSGAVTSDWRAQRLRVECTVEDPLPFLDVEAPQTHTYLSAEMSAELTSLGIPEIDVARVRGPNRLLTRAISTWAFAAVDDEGGPRFGGLRYVSRLGDYECWAVFDGSDLRETARTPVLLEDRAMRDVADIFNLRVF